MLERVLDLTHPIWHDGLDRHAYGRSRAAQMKTAWGRRFQRPWKRWSRDDTPALSNATWRSSTVNPVRICGIDSVTDPARRGLGHAAGAQDAARSSRADRSAGGAPVRPTESRGRRANRLQRDPLGKSPAAWRNRRHGAPMMMVRGGENGSGGDQCDGAVRADAFRLNGPLPPGARHRLRSVRDHQEATARRSRTGRRAAAAFFHRRGRNNGRGLRRRQHRRRNVDTRGMRRSRRVRRTSRCAAPGVDRARTG